MSMSTKSFAFATNELQTQSVINNGKKVGVNMYFYSYILLECTFTFFFMNYDVNTHGT